MAAYLKCAGVQKWWDEVKPMWPDHVAERMDRIVAEYDGLPMTEVLSHLTQDEH